MSIQNILNHYRASAEKKLANVKWNPKASDEVKKGLLKLLNDASWVPIIARFEGFYGHPYSEHRPKRPLEKRQTRIRRGQYNVRDASGRAGQATIGYGHVLRPHHAGGQMADWWDPYWGKGGKRITKEEARNLLYHNGRSYATIFLKAFTAVPTQGQFNVILSRAYIGGPYRKNRGLYQLIRYVNNNNSRAFNNKLRTYYDYAFTEKYEDPNWCVDNLASYRDNKGYKELTTDAQKIEKCKGRIQYTKRYRRGWRNRTNIEYKIATGQDIPKGFRKPLETTGTANKSDMSGERIVLIGDSNSYQLNKYYASHYKSQGADVHQFTYGGTGCDYWRKVIERYDSLDGKRVSPSGKIDRGVWRLQTGGKKGWKAGPVGPTQIHVVCLGGNNMNRIYKESTLRAHVDGCIKPLMRLIKKYNGTFAGTVPVGSRRRGKTGEPSNVLRARMNAEYEKAAKEIGISFWNPTANIAYDTDALSKRKDSVHITRTMARQEFESRKSWLSGGASSGVGFVGGGSMQGIAAGGGDNKGRFDHLKVDVSVEDFLGQYAAMRQRDKSKDKSFEEMRDEYRKSYSKQMKKMFGDNYVDQYARDPRYGDKPEDAEKPSTPQKPGDPAQGKPANGCPEGRFVNKYKNFPTQVPDFNFNDFYDDLDKYFGSAEDMLQPQGKDCVFGDEHYAAWSKLQQKKQMQSPYVSEAKSFLKRLIDEMKKRY